MNNPHKCKYPKSVILYGGTGQAKVVRPILEHYGAKVVAVFDDTPNLPRPFPDVPLFRGHELAKWLAGRKRAGIGFSITIGNPHGRARLRLHALLAREGMRPVTVIHPTAWIADSARIGEGCQIMAGAIICAEARIGRQCIINTKASIDHEDFIEEGCEVAPGATLCGLVHMRVNSWVCAGATVLPGITIGEDSTVGAGAVVTANVPAGVTVVGIPARTLGRKRRQR